MKNLKTLVIGGGFSGMSAAILLAESGHAVDLVEIDPGWRSYGAGISLNGGIFRVMDRLSILEPFRAVGSMTDGLEVRGPQDQVFATIPTPSLQAGVTGTGAVMRPVLARLLVDRVRASAVNVRLGLTFLTITENGAGVRVTFDDGTAGDYDLVVGADGLNSATRTALFPDAPKPRYIGQGVWRAVLPRPAHLPTIALWMGPQLKLGLNHVSQTQSYLFLTENRATNDFVPAETHVETLRGLLERFPSPTIRKIAAELSADHQIVYRPLEQMLMPRPWYRGRVVLIGDAVHATTPHLAAGAMIGMEDAVVLAEELAAATTVTGALDAFQNRRWDRCRMVVENSLRLAEIEMGQGTADEHKQVMGQTMRALTAPI